MFGKSRPPKRVYVLGAGPAGLLAAQAAATKGYAVTIFSKHSGNNRYAAKSDLYGCQYLHAFIPGVGLMNDGWVPVKYTVDGPTDGYRRKVYGDQWNGAVSPDEYGPEDDHKAWDLRRAYDNLWDMWKEFMTCMVLGADNVRGLFDDPHAYVISTVPAHELCRSLGDHKFSSASIWAMGSKGAEDAQARLPFVAPESTVICNGWRDTRWYRAATVFGHSTLEFPAGTKPPISGVVAVNKPLSTDCTCWRGKQTLRVGRYGKWQKGVLVHEAYYETLRWLP